MREATWSLPALVNAVATGLGPDWKPVGEEERDLRKLQKGDVVLHFYQATYGSPAELGKVKVSGSYHHLSGGVNGGYYSPRDYGVVKYNESEPSIGVSVSRGAAVVVKEIQRRLLPEVERITAAVKVAVADRVAYQDQSQVNAEKLARAVGGLVQENYGGNSREVAVYANGNGVYISARVSGSSVRFEHFSVDIATALKIGEAVQAMAPQQEAA